ncbi:hypothetical protein HLK59_04800 [Streptomyces sp. S3(2020)]|uniref:helix-turn-helix domain-containing protein n=1 Tax=Streptomyces sp. S3(2020) TaxID=2732044 RepID=UPI0014876501|nr:helix-turn-helix domain-containing protein [Streptomyces sp. S3(2020)]NNN29684.1 hypothetical protein [Streptomyces sp. S3(2020)]
MTISEVLQAPMPSHPRRRDGRAPLPRPEERLRLRRAWHLSEQQVATAFGVTVVTVRSWEAGRTAPTGLRRAAYAAFLNGLAQGLVQGQVPAPAGPAASPRVPAEFRAAPVAPGPAPLPAGLPVGDGPDPVSLARRRRFRLAAVAAGVWTVFAHVMITSPPPHP